MITWIVEVTKTILTHMTSFTFFVENGQRWKVESCIRLPTYIVTLPTIKYRVTQIEIFDFKWL